MNYPQSVANAYFHPKDPMRFMAVSKLAQPFSEEFAPEPEAPAFGQVEPPVKTVSQLLFEMMDHRNYRVNQGGMDHDHHYLTAEPEALIKAHNDAVKEGRGLGKLSDIKHTFDLLHMAKPASSKRLANGTFVNVIY